MKAPNRLTVQRISEQGFSLIEIAIVVAIIGLLLVPFLMEYNNQEKMRAIDASRTSTASAATALKKYAIKYGRYPRPANPSIPSGARVTIGSLTFGPGDEQPNEDATPPAPPFPNCPAAGVSLTSACRGLGTRDTFADDDGSSPTTADGPPDFVFVGTLPYATIGLTEAQGIDGFGNKLSYTVSAAMTVGPPFDDEFGTIRVADSIGNDDGTVGAVADGTAGNNRAHFIVISHGASGVGAYNMLGTQNIRCGALTDRRDNNNCNYDGVFDDGSITYTYFNSETGTNVTVDNNKTRTTGNTDQAWDNYFEYTDSVSSDMWIPTTNNQDMQSRNVDAVRINSSSLNSRVRVDVGGDVRADKVYTDNLCVTDPTDDSCVMPAAIGTDTEPPYRPNPSTDAPGIRCSAFSAMTGIANGNEECGNLTAGNLGSLNMPGCPPNMLPNGITANGTVTCALAY